MQRKKTDAAYCLLPTTYRFRGGFSLIEIIIFIGMFSAVIVAFISLLVIVNSTYMRNSGATEVATQSQFLLQTVQYAVERSSLIDIAKDSATSTLVLRTASSTEDPTIITLSNGIVTMAQGNGGARNLTSNKVTVTALSFTKRENVYGHDSVAVNFTIQYNTTNAQRRFVHGLKSSIARVSAATFDSNVVPNAATYDLGTSGSPWRSINNVMYFSGNNVGIGISSPQTPLQVVGNLYLSSSTSGILLKSPNSTCYLLGITNGGAITTSSATCL